MLSLDFAETIIDHADLLVSVFNSGRPIETKMEFLMLWLDNFKDEVQDHPCKEFIRQIRDDVRSRNTDNN
jgi:propanediol dehydratase small subunit